MRTTGEGGGGGGGGGARSVQYDIMLSYYFDQEHGLV